MLFLLYQIDMAVTQNLLKEAGEGSTRPPNSKQAMFLMGDIGLKQGKWSFPITSTWGGPTCGTK